MTASWNLDIKKWLSTKIVDKHFFVLKNENKSYKAKAQSNINIAHLFWCYSRLLLIYGDVGGAYSDDMAV